jgi:hypothetical protein
MSAILDLGTVYSGDNYVNPIGGGVFVWLAPSNYLCEVIAANTNEVGNDKRIYIYIKHPGDDAQDHPEDHYGWLAYNLPLPGYNIYQTFRFAINPGDSVYVGGDGEISYHIQGIEQVY